MVPKDLLDNVLALPASDRLDLVHQVWDSLRDVELPLSEEDKLELDRRYDEYLADPEAGESWEEVEAFVKARLRP